MSQTVFVTGASGYIGSAVARRLAEAGYKVCGLTRNPLAAQQMTNAGVEPVIGDMCAVDGWVERAAGCDAIVHTAFDGTAAWDADAAALTAFEKAAERGLMRKLIYTSGVWVHGDSAGAEVDETSPLRPVDLVKPRTRHEARVLALSNIEVMVLRPAVVYGEARGIIGGWFEEALTRRTINYPGDGEQLWPLVHRDDLAEAYLLALRRGKRGEVYLASDGSALRVKQLAGAVAKACGASAKAWPAAQVLEKLGPYGAALLLSQRVSSAKAERELGWRPNHTDFISEAPALLREFHAASD